MLGFIKMSALSAVLSFGVVTAIHHDWSAADAGSTKIYTDRVAAASPPPLPVVARLPRQVVTAGAVEESNVDLSEQLVNLIIAQRNYQANAKTIETANATTQTIINLR